MESPGWRARSSIRPNVEKHSSTDMRLTALIALASAALVVGTPVSWSAVVRPDYVSDYDKQLPNPLPQGDGLELNLGNALQDVDNAFNNINGVYAGPGSDDSAQSPPS